MTRRLIILLIAAIALSQTMRYVNTVEEKRIVALAFITAVVVTALYSRTERIGDQM
jgi:hypothetical protein